MSKRTGRKFLRTISVSVMPLLAFSGCSPGADQSMDVPHVEVVVDDEGDRVDVTVDRRPFTSYLYADAVPSVRKPILYPVFAPSGKRVTRGYPLNPIPGERADHPHQVGVWLNHGDVNDLDFWNNSDAVDPADSLHFGSIRHRDIVDASSGYGTGSMSVVADWTSPRGATLLKEHTRFAFRVEPSSWIIDRTTTLTAVDDAVVFEDSKEGMMAIRVARALEEVTNRADPFVAQDGSLTEPIVDNDGATGHYFNSEGLEGDDVWGQRATWTALSGVIDGETVTIVILDHPSNVNYPTHWMARGYGLFAANPLGSRDYTEGAEHLDYALAPGESITFRYRMLVHTGAKPSPEWIDTQSARFALSDE